MEKFLKEKSALLKYYPNVFFKVYNKLKTKGINNKNFNLIEMKLREENESYIWKITKDNKYLLEFGFKSLENGMLEYFISGDTGPGGPGQPFEILKAA